MGGLDDIEEEEEDDKKHPNAGFCRVMTYYSPKPLGFFGVFLSCCSAAGFPIFGIFMAKVLFIIG